MFLGHLSNIFARGAFSTSVNYLPLFNYKTKHAETWQRLIHENSIEMYLHNASSVLPCSLTAPQSLGTGSNCWPYFELWMLVACLTAILHTRAVRLLLNCAVIQCVKAKSNASFRGCALCFLNTSCYFSKFHSNERNLCLVNYVT